MFQSTQVPLTQSGADLELAMLGVLLFTLILATYHDLTQHRIPNVLVLVAIVSALAMRSVNDGSMGMLLAISGGLVGLVLFLPFYFIRAMGAGDVKLMASVGSLLGPVATLLACGLTLIAGAMIATALLVYCRVLKQKFPYAIAIACGSIAAVILTGTLQVL